MRFIIFGAGSVGSVLGGYLTQTGNHAVLVGRPQHVKQIRDHGLLLNDRDGEHVVRLPAVEAISETMPSRDDIVFLCTKSQDTDAAITDLKAWASAETPVFCFQNGVRNEEIASQFFNNVYGVLVAIGGRYLAPGHVAHYASRAVTMGRYPEGIGEHVAAVRAALETAGCKVTLTPEIMAVKWSKLIINLCNAFYALTGLSIPEAHQHAESRYYLADVMEEGIEVLEAAGIDYQSLPGRISLREEIARLRRPEPVQPWPEDPDFNYYPSTWQDLQLKRGNTETIFLNGEIISLGKVYRVPTPYSELLAGLVEEMATKRELPGKYSIAQLRALMK